MAAVLLITTSTGLAMLWLAAARSYREQVDAQAPAPLHGATLVEAQFPFVTVAAGFVLVAAAAAWWVWRTGRRPSD